MESSTGTVRYYFREWLASMATETEEHYYVYYYYFNDHIGMEIGHFSALTWRVVYKSITCSANKDVRA